MITDSSATPTALCWSGGKDSALALAAMADRPAVLLTTCTEGYDRISMHGVRRVLLEQQAKAVGLPLRIAWIPQQASNEIYLERMAEALENLRAEFGIGAVAFGDLFLEDIRKFRESQLEPLGLEPQFPIWGRDTTALAKEFVKDGYRAIAVCVDPNQIDPGFVGRELNPAFFADLPPSADPCGENGEFHTFVFDGPIFQNPVHLEVGEKVNRDLFWFCDLLPLEEDATESSL